LEGIKRGEGEGGLHRTLGERTIFLRSFENLWGVVRLSSKSIQDPLGIWFKKVDMHISK
jgi:hypothetical protein